MSAKTISEFLNEQAGGHISFHMPGHKGRSRIYEGFGHGEFLQDIMSRDITEIPGADALFCPETTIRAVMDNYADLYGVRHTELLVNGSSAGVMSAILSSVPIGGKLIMGRNSHHSAFSALKLGGIMPVYVRPEIDPDFGLTAEITPASVEKACTDNPDASAVFITSPNYYGMMSDISSIATIAHSHGMILIVDQAHGAHLRFFDYDAERIKRSGGFIPHLKHSAEALGADIVVNSTHKTLLSFTGSGIINVCTDRVDIDALVRMLRMLQTTSPSYLLMGSLDINEKIMREHGTGLIDSWRTDLSRFYRRALRIDGLTLVTGYTDIVSGGDEPEKFGMYHERAGYDMTKINISMAGLGLDGYHLDRELRLKGIISEMVHGEFVMLMTGAGNVSSDYDRLLEALNDIAASYGIVSQVDLRPREDTVTELEVSCVPADTEAVPLYAAEGRVVYDPVTVYPPGTPIACPGEILDSAAVNSIAQAISRGDKVTGISEDGLIRVGINL